MNIQAKAKEFRIDVSRVWGLLELGFSKTEIYELVVHSRTLARRTDKLSLEESDKVQRLERIMAFAYEVFADKKKAEGWLRDKNRALEGERPVDLLVSETGAYEVEQILGRIHYGIFS